MTRDDGKTTLWVKITAELGTPASETSLPVPPILAESLYQTVCYVVSQAIDGPDVLARDGIIVCGAIVSDSFSRDAFEFWSPECDHLPHRLVEALFALVPPQTTAMTLRSYLRSLRQYFDFDRSPF